MDCALDIRRLHWQAPAPQLGGLPCHYRQPHGLGSLPLLAAHVGLRRR